MLDHGDGYHTIYAHLAEVLRPVGARVFPGEVVGDGRGHRLSQGRLPVLRGSPPGPRRGPDALGGCGDGPSAVSKVVDAARHEVLTSRRGPPRDAAGLRAQAARRRRRRVRPAPRRRDTPSTPTASRARARARRCCWCTAWAGSANGWVRILRAARPATSRPSTRWTFLATASRRSPASGPLTLEEQLGVLHAFCREVVKAPAFVVGNSLGGALSVILAATHPEDVAALGARCSGGRRDDARVAGGADARPRRAHHRGMRSGSPAGSSTAPRWWRSSSPPS